MEQKIVMKIIEECGDLYDTLPNEQLTMWDYFVNVNNIVGRYDGVDCLININIENGNMTKGICVITDWKPGALAFQSDEGELPKMRVVYPEEYMEFMMSLEPILDAKYPAIPGDQE